MNLKQFVWPSNRLKRLGVIIAGVLFLYTLLGFFLLPKVIQHIATSTLSKKLQRQAHIEKVSFNPYLLSCELSGLSIEKQSDKGDWININRLFVNLQASSLFKQALIVNQLLIESPHIFITRHSDRTYNFSDLLNRETESKAKEESEPLRFSINNIQILSGEVEFIDQPVQTRHIISNLNFTLPTISNFPYAVETFVEPHFEAEANNMSFKLGGQTKPFAQSRQSQFDMVINELALGKYLCYLPGQRNFNLDKGTLSTELKLTYAAPSHEVPYLKLDGNVELNELKVTNQMHKDDVFCNIPKLSIDLEGGNLLAGELHIKKVQLQKPQINLVRDQNKSFFYPSVYQESKPLAKENTFSQSKSKDIFSLDLDHLQLEAGNITFTDKSTTPNFSTRLEPVRFSLEELQTNSKEPCKFKLDMRTFEGENINISGNFGLNPMNFKAEAKLSDLLLNLYAPYYSPYFKGTINQGTCNLALDISLNESKASGIQLEHLSLGLNDLLISDAQGQSVLKLPRFALQEGRIVPSNKEIELGSAVLEKGEFKVKRKANGALNIKELAAVKSFEQASPKEDKEAPKEPWQFALNKLKIDKCEGVFIDETTPSPVKISTSDIFCHLENLSNVKNKKGSLESSLQVANKGQIKAQGDFSLSPLEVSLEIDLNSLDLKPIAPFVGKYTNIALNKAILGSKGKIEIKQSNTGKTPLLSFQGETAIQDLSTSETEQNSDFLAWKKLKLDGMSFVNDPLSIYIQNIELFGLDTQLLLYPEGSSNIQKALAIKTSQGQKSDRSQDQSQKASILVDNIKLTQGKLKFLDKRVSPDFQTTLSNLQGTITGLSNQKEETEKISVQANLGRNAPLKIEGRADLLAEQLFTDMALDLTNIALSPLSPYSGKYIGYKISKGKLNLDSKVQIKGQKLQSHNSLLLDQFTLGDNVESPEAVNAPVKLGIALLKNRKGEIHINKTVSGDLSDPEFTIGDLVMRVFVNVLVKAATSPFSILGAMFGGGEDMNIVLFSPGQTNLDQEARQKMQTLAKALYERPELNMDVQGRADTSKDKATLQKMRFQNMLREQKYLDLGKKEQAETNIKDVRITSEEYPTYLWEAYKAAPMEKPQNALGLTKKLPPEELEKRLRDYISISNEDLRQLAKNRALAVIEFLNKNGPVKPDRLFLQNIELGTDSKDTFTRVEMRIH